MLLLEFQRISHVSMQWYDGPMSLLSYPYFLESNVTHTVQEEGL